MHIFTFPLLQIIAGIQNYLLHFIFFRIQCSQKQEYRFKQETLKKDAEVRTKYQTQKFCHIKYKLWRWAAGCEFYLL